MRPVRLELAGFTAFRQPTVVDFADTELFALSGPTGSGKSSVIDAMVFALYGSVPRLDDRRLVAPLVSQGQLQAKVRFDFTVDGQSYTAVRVVQRTAKGATTKEARLEREKGSVAEILAGNADEVSRAVEELLGLRFEHFNRCVVLPQGEFAKFLHDKPSDRQDLLVELLDLGLYRTMGQQARARQEEAENRRKLAEARLADLADATPERLAALVARLEQLDALVAEIDRREPAISVLDQQIASQAAVAEQARQAMEQLGAVAVPAGVAELAIRLTSAQRTAEEAAGAEAAAREVVARVAADRARLGDRDRLRDWLASRDRLATEETRLDKGRALSAEWQAKAAAAARANEAAQQDLVVAQRRLDQAEWDAKADALVERLVPGEPCPVCRQVVHDLPLVHVPEALDGARIAVDAAGGAAQQVADEAAAADRQLASVLAKLAEVEAVVAGLREALRDAPSRRDAIDQLDQIERADRAVEDARRADQQSRDRRTEADRVIRALAEQERDARVAFDSVRDALASLGPPTPARRDLAADWAELVAWAAATAPELDRARREAGDEQQRLVAERDRLSAEVRTLVADAGVDVGRGRPRDAAVAERAGGAAEHRRTVEALAQAELRRAEVAAAVAEATTAAGLAAHLRANRFEKWVLDAALDRLCTSATERLRQLSSGAYSLAVDDKGAFLVVDHLNADERRLARTLSGGETFLASLALALALADEVASLAARGAARLESIFLDEGFGTLDPETLDVVAAAIEELGSTGRVVGLISHVPELAERVPVHYRVTKGPSSSTVERIEQ